MAITAAITISDATTVPGQVVTATCTVTNSGSSSVNVVGIKAKAMPTSGTVTTVAVAVGEPPIGPGATVAVAGSNGTLALPFGVVGHAPTSGFGLSMPSSYVYDIGATVYTSDGAITEASTTTLTVSSPSHN